MDNLMIIRLSLSAAFCIGLFASLLTNTSHAATYEAAGGIPQDSAMWQFLQGPTHAEYLARVAAQEDARIGLACDQPAQYLPGALKIISPVTMEDGDPMPTAGQWIERYTMQACDRSRIYNALLTVTENGTLSILPVVPGQSARDFTLLRDLRPIMEQSADIPDCNAKTVFNTFLNTPQGYEPQNADAQYETWFVGGCGQSRAMVLAFTAGEGDNINVSIEKQLTINATNGSESAADE